MSKPDKSFRQSKNEKMVKIAEYLNSVASSGGGRLTLKEICMECEIPYNGHSSDCIMAVTDTAKNSAFIHHVSIGIGANVRYEIEILPNA